MGIFNHNSRLATNFAFPASSVFVANHVLGEFVLIFIARKRYFEFLQSFIKSFRLTIYCKCDTATNLMAQASRVFLRDSKEFRGS